MSWTTKKTAQIILYKMTNEISCICLPTRDKITISGGQAARMDFENYITKKEIENMKKSNLELVKWLMAKMVALS